MIESFMKKMVASSVAIPFSKLLFSSEKLKKSKKFSINFLQHRLMNMVMTL